MAEHDGRLLTERIQHADSVRSMVEHSIALDRLGRVSAAIASHVRRDRVVAGIGERRKLVAPRVPQLRKAVHQ